MTLSVRGFVLPALLLIVVASLIGESAYIYLQNKSAHPEIATGVTSSAIIPSTISAPPVSKSLKPTKYFTPQIATTTIDVAYSSGTSELIGTSLCLSQSKIAYLKRMGVNTIGTSSTTKDALPCIAPEAIIEAANTYLISHLGQEYVSKYLIFRPNDTVSMRDGTEAVFWSLVYNDTRFARELQWAKPLSIELKIYGQSTAITSDLPDCAHRPLLCANTVTEAQALETARLNGLNTDASKKFTHYIGYAKHVAPGWAWYLRQSDPAKDLCGSKSKSVARTLEINVGTGEMSPIVMSPGDCLPIPGL
jgi:hypothetical protein